MGRLHALCGSHPVHPDPQAALCILLAPGQQSDPHTGGLRCPAGPAGSRMNCTWTAERDSQVTALWHSGETCSAIAAAVGVTKNSIVGRARRLKLPSRPSPIDRSGAGRKPRSKPARAPRITLPSACEPVPVVIAAPVIAPRAVNPNECCQWPMTNGRPWVFCGAQRQTAGGVYCADHRAVAYVKHKRVISVFAAEC